MANRIVLTRGEMHYADKWTIEKNRMTGFALMERAGAALFQSIIDHQLFDRNQDILVLAGSGNNGGDALVIASLLHEEGYPVRIHTIGHVAHRSVNTSKALNLAKEKHIACNHLDPTTFASFEQDLKTADHLIDGMFGTGFDQRLDDFRTSVIETVNKANLNVISIDLPSGINARNGLCRTAIEANHTFIVQYEKPGNLLGDAPDYHGKRIIVDCGIDIPEDLQVKRKTVDKDGVVFNKRAHNTHKYDYGHLLVIGGSSDMMGAPLLSAMSAMRTGAGLVTALYGSWCFRDRMNIVPEIMSASFSDQAQLQRHLRKKHAVVFGMGFGKNEQSFDVIRPIIDAGIPAVIDADGLTHLKRSYDSNDRLEHVLITPHLKEFADLIDLSVEDVKNDPLKHTEAYARQTGMTILLKGACTLLTDGKTTYFSDYGNPGLATAGSGDVLDGIIGALMAQGEDMLEAAQMGLVLHGMAGDLARNRYGERSMIARDIINELSVVIKHRII